MDLVQSQGKQNKKVATIFLPEMVRAVDTLIDTRVSCGINPTNKYIFSNSAGGHLDTWKVLRTCAELAGCEKPELISATRLRKYLATVCQIMMMTESEKTLLSNHLAHNIKTHDSFYKIQEASLSLAKVSKLLILAENGNINQYEGTSIKDIEVEREFHLFLLRLYLAVKIHNA